MKILHICLASFYIDNYSYQENVLPRMHKKMGHDVQILASTETFIDGNSLGYVKPATYKNEDDILVIRIPYAKGIPHKLATKLRIYPDFTEYLEKFMPDLIFLHDVQFLSIRQIVNYAKKHKVRIIADGHADFSNSARSILSRWILHGCVYYPIIKMAEPYIERFYGTLPARVEFFKKVYHIPDEKVSFLPMGVDDDLAYSSSNERVRKEIRNQYGVKESDFLIVTGGKIDVAKTQTLLLMEAINRIDDMRIKLLIFGSVSKELKKQFDDKCGNHIVYAGWATVEQSYKFFSASDLVVFPGRHSVYWEQAAGLGKPLVVKYWEGTTHVDLGGNALFLYDDSVIEIQKKIESIVFEDGKFEKMVKVAKKRGMEFFSYYSIAQRSIE